MSRRGRTMHGCNAWSVVAGRTDRGVHAKHQLISVRTERSHDHEALVAALNEALPKDVRVLSAREGLAVPCDDVGAPKAYAYYWRRGRANEVAWRVEGRSRRAGLCEMLRWQPTTKCSLPACERHHCALDSRRRCGGTRARPAFGGASGPARARRFRGGRLPQAPVRRMVGSSCARARRAGLRRGAAYSATPLPDVSSRARRARVALRDSADFTGPRFCHVGSCLLLTLHGLRNRAEPVLPVSEPPLEARAMEHVRAG